MESKRPRTSHKQLRIASVLLLMALAIYCVGCRTPNPLAGWKNEATVKGDNVDDLRGGKNSTIPESQRARLSSMPKGVMDDCMEFIRKKESSHKYFIDWVSVCSDGTGRWAVAIDTLKDHTYVNYILIYDKTGKRVKTIRRTKGSYSC